jgi:hypothetical protein
MLMSSFSNCWTATIGGKPWRCLRVPHDEIKEQIA